MPHIHLRFTEPRREDAPAAHRATLLLSALTIHNIPEGLAVDAFA